MCSGTADLAKPCYQGGSSGARGEMIYLNVCACVCEKLDMHTVEVTSITSGPWSSGRTNLQTKVWEMVGGAGEDLNLMSIASHDSFRIFAAGETLYCHSGSFRKIPPPPPPDMRIGCSRETIDSKFKSSLKS